MNEDELIEEVTIEAKSLSDYAEEVTISKSDLKIPQVEFKVESFSDDLKTDVMAWAKQVTASFKNMGTTLAGASKAFSDNFGSKLTLDGIRKKLFSNRGFSVRHYHIDLMVSDDNFAPRLILVADEETPQSLINSLMEELEMLRPITVATEVVLRKKEVRMSVFDKIKLRGSG